MDPSKMEPPTVTSQLKVLHSSNETNRFPARVPNVFSPGDDFELWEARMKFFLRDAPAEDAQKLILSYLSDGAARQFLSCRLPQSAPVQDIWSCLRELFGDTTFSEVYADQFYLRKQEPSESIRAYLGSLRELAAKAFPEKSGAELENEILCRFRSGVRQHETRSEFIRHPPTQLTKALEIALGYEAVENLERPFSLTYVGQSRRPSNFTATRRFRTTTRGAVARGTRGNCPYCMRFGRLARSCGHNFPQWNTPRTGESQTNALIPIFLLTYNVATAPLTLPGTIQGRDVKILVDTGATCSIVNPRFTKGARLDPTRGFTLVMANGTKVPVKGKVSLNLGIAGRVVQHNFLVAHVSWDVIVGTDFMTTYGVIVNVRDKTILLEQPRVSDEQCATICTDRTNSWISEILRGTSVSEVDRRGLIETLTEFVDVFDSNCTTIGRTTVLKHTIDTGNHHPIRQPCRRVPVHYQAELEEMLQDMLEKKIIRPSSSPWASPIVLVKKKDGTLRLCVDYRRLNAVTKKDSFPLPRIDTTLDAVSGARFFTTLDMASGYWQVEVCPRDRAKTAFIVPSGLYEFETMPFGLTNAPATFQRLMQRVLSELIPKACLVYLDDIIIHGATIDEHNERLRQVLYRIKKAGLKLKLKKCQFLREEVPFLGHILSARGVEVDNGKIEKIIDWPTPKSVTEVQSFLGLAAYYRRYVHKFAEIAAPLHRLTEKGRNFMWTKECDTAFRLLKTTLTSPPVLAFPDTSPSAGPFVLDTDASDLAIGAVLSQVQGGEERVIAYASRQLDKRERRYCTTRKEMLALVYFLKHFRPYLLGRPFIVRTDHHSLQWLQNFKDPLGQIARWQEQLQEYCFQCQYRRGQQHGNADALSRLPTSEQPSVAVCQFISDNHRWATCQEADPDFQLIYRRQISNSPKPTGREMRDQSTAAKSLWNLWSKIVLVEGVMFLRNSSGAPPRVIVPRTLVPEVIDHIHTELGHAGQRKTEAAIRQRFWWPLIHNDIIVFCQQCDTCQRIKSLNPQPKAPMQPIAVDGPNYRIGIDIMGPLPVTKTGNRYILVMIDYFTKWCEAVPLRQADAPSVSHAFVQEWICRYGAPHFLHSDQGSAFENQLLKATCNLLHINKTRTTPYHPQGNGLVERTNRTLKGILQALVDRENSDVWDSQLPTALLAYRAAVHSTTGFSPAFLRLGQEIRLPKEIQLPAVPAESIGVPEYVQQLQRRLFVAFRQARESIMGGQQHQKSNHDRGAQGPGYRVGDLVLLFRPKPSQGIPAKFHKPWHGPYLIVYQRSPQVYVLRDPHRPSADVLTVHYNQLKPYRETNTHSYLQPIPSTSDAPPPVLHLEVPPEGGQATEITNAEGTADSALIEEGERCNGIETVKANDLYFDSHNSLPSYLFPGEDRLNAIWTDGEDKPTAEEGHKMNTQTENID